jgi:hypothetical protein
LSRCWWTKSRGGESIRKIGACFRRANFLIFCLGTHFYRKIAWTACTTTPDSAGSKTTDYFSINTSHLRNWAAVAARTSLFQSVDGWLCQTYWAVKARTCFFGGIGKCSWQGDSAALGTSGTGAATDALARGFAPWCRSCLGCSEGN